MRYRNMNYFLEVWFQKLDSWLWFITTIEDLEERNIFKICTLEMMRHFIQNVTDLDINATPFVNYTFVWDEDF